jgi:hypothetical protein
MLLAFPVFDNLTALTTIIDTPNRTGSAIEPAKDYVNILSQLKRILSESLSLKTFLTAIEIQVEIVDSDRYLY